MQIILSTQFDFLHDIHSILQFKSLGNYPQSKAGNTCVNTRAVVIDATLVHVEVFVILLVTVAVQVVNFIISLAPFTYVFFCETVNEVSC